MFQQSDVLYNIFSFIILSFFSLVPCLFHHSLTTVTEVRVVGYNLCVFGRFTLTAALQLNLIFFIFIVLFIFVEHLRLHFMYERCYINTF